MALRRPRRSVPVVLAVATAAAAVQLAGAPPARAAGDPVIAVVGNIACDPSDPAFNGGNGTASACQMKATGAAVKAGNYKAVLPLGDNQYDNGTLTKYKSVYDKYWGPVKSISHPVPGNHEYLDAGAAGYFGYFGGNAGAKGKGWYSYDIGTWHLIALNSNCSAVGGCGVGSPQETWLRNDLAAHPNACVLAYWHHARFSSGEDGDNPASAAFWDDLYRAGAEIVVHGHAHEYERFAPQTPAGTVDPTYGIREFIDGTGGKSFEPTAPRAANSEVLVNGIFGFLTLTLKPGGYAWKYVPAAGSTFTESGTGSCHDAPPVGLSSAPQAVDGTPADGQAVVAWGAPANDGGSPVTSYTVTASPGGRTVTVPGSTLTTAITGLTNGTAYTFTVTASNANGTSPASTPSRAITPRPPPGAVDYPTTVQGAAPAAYWRLDEVSGTTASDASGNGRTGWFSGGVTLGVSGAVSTGTAAQFDGATGALGVDDATPLRLNGPFTLELWAKQAAFANSYPGLLRKGTASTPDGYLVWYAPDGTVHFKRNGLDVATRPGALASTYRSLVLTYDGSTARWYVDGALNTTTSVAFPPNNGSTSLVLGQGDQPGAESLDEVAIYPSALTASTVAAHVQAAQAAPPPPPPPPPPSSDYRSAVLSDGPSAYWRLGETSGTVAADASGNGYAGTYVGGVTQGQPGAFGADPSASFDGVDDRVSVPDASPLRCNGAFTIEFWGRLNAFANSYPGILGKGPSATADGYLIWYASDGTMHFKRNNVDVATPSGTLQSSRWRHFAVTYDGTTLRWYADGAQVSSRAATLPANNGAATLLLGQGDQPGNESLDEVAIYPTALSASRLAAHVAAAGA